MTGPHSSILPPGTPLEPGRMYARLFHGRTNPNRDMDGWGFDGPLFGPLASVAVTYLQHVRLAGLSSAAGADLWAADDLLPRGGAYYGDCVVFVARAGDSA